MKPILIVLFIASMFSSFACNSSTTKAKETTNTDVQKIEVYYFHYTRRCATCNAVETETLKALKKLYASQYDAGTLTFKSVNLDEEENNALAEKCNAPGQSLLIISGEKRFDLTNKAFMYAINSPEKLEAEIKKSIDSI